jgi:hypothetical protein
MNDLTVIMLTLNKLPDKWNEIYQKFLNKAIGDMPLITISKEPMAWGDNYLQVECDSCESAGVTNIYRQMLRGSKLAQTEYVAFAEDDVLYCPDHFAYRPKKRHFAFNLSRWGIFTWGIPFYFLKNKPANCSLIAHRNTLINALEKRFMLYPTIFPYEWQANLGEVNRESKPEWYSTRNPIVQFSHRFEVDPLGQKQKKRPWSIMAYDIPYWGRAEEIREWFE